MPNEKTDDSRLTQVIQIASTNNILGDKPTSNTDMSDIGGMYQLERYYKKAFFSITYMSNIKYTKQFREVN